MNVGGLQSLADDGGGGGEEGRVNERVDNVDMWLPLVVCFIVDFAEGIDLWLEGSGDEESESCLCGREGES